MNNEYDFKLIITGRIPVKTANDEWLDGEYDRVTDLLLDGIREIVEDELDGFLDDVELK